MDMEEMDEMDEKAINIEEMEMRLENYIEEFTAVLDNMHEFQCENSIMEEEISDSISIPPRDNIFDLLTEEDMEEIDMFTDETIYEYMQTEIENMHKQDFHEIMKTDISELVFEQLTNIFSTINNLSEDDIYEDIHEFVSIQCDNYFEHNGYIPPRSYLRENHITDEIISRNKIEESILRLQSIEQPKQRTEEWYNQRYNLITASNAWKAFSTEYQINSLIYEKCKPYYTQYSGISSNTQSSLHWGTKFEPLTVIIYEKIRNTKISDFGCIPHQKYSFLGASPDGIILDKDSPLYGRMIEIKNIVNRDITGIPKMEYWIQMQLQMETCDLDYCDFVETRFKLFESEEQFYENPDNYENRGVILYFIQKNTNEHHYVFMPLDIENDKDIISEWIKNKKTELKETHILFETQYWYLDEISIVLVKRNREWFNAGISKLESVWNKIEEYRKNGKYEELKTSSEKQSQKGGPICLIKLDENGDKIE